jgi:hypothetical protein
VWQNQQFWEAAFYQDVQKDIKALYLPRLETSPPNSHLSCDSSISPREVSLPNIVHLTSIPCCSTDKLALQAVFDLCKGSVPETFHNPEFMKELTSPPFISHTSLVTYTFLQCRYTCL